MVALFLFVGSSRYKLNNIEFHVVKVLSKLQNGSKSGELTWLSFSPAY